MADAVAAAVPPQPAPLYALATTPKADALTLTPDQLLVKIERLLDVKEYALAKTLAESLAQDPQYRFRAEFLHGLASVEMGELKEAIGQFRAALAEQPQATRVRLELARALMLKGDDGAAAYHFRIASQADDVPEDVRATINSSLATLRNRKAWHLNVEAAIVPDTNVTGGTRATQVDIDIGGATLPFTLGGNSRQRSGIGQSANLSAGYRLGKGKISWQADLDASGLNYGGKDLDDFNVQAAFGPSYRSKSGSTQGSLQGIFDRRWFGGTLASKQLGIRANVQQALSNVDRIGFSIDSRRTTSLLSRDYSGWNTALFVTYEKAMTKTMVASASVFGKRERLREKAYSSNEYGVAVGVGGELPHGINAGLSLTVSHAAFAAPMRAFSPDPRDDWRVSGRAYAGLRNVRFLGLSPSVTYNYLKNNSSLTLYRSERSRFAFTLARYF